MSLDVGSLVNTFTLAELEYVLHRMFNHASFVAWNPLLTAGERAGLRQSPVIWPAKPVFSPYAAVKDQHANLHARRSSHRRACAHTSDCCSEFSWARSPPGEGCQPPAAHRKVH